MSKTKIDPLRAAVASAIERVTTAKQRREAVSAAIVRARSTVASASGDLEEAEAGMSLAREAQATRIAAAAVVGVLTPDHDSSLLEARAKVADTQDRLAAARSALTKLEAEVDDAKARDVFDRPTDAVSIAERALDAAITALIKGQSYEKFIAETVDLQNELIGRRLVLARFCQKRFIDSNAEPLHSLMVDYILPYHINHTTQYLNGFGRDCEFHPAVVPWEAAMASLRTDANTPLPLEAA